MKHLLETVGDWEKILSNSYLLLFMDYDGTLTPIVERPEKAILSEKMKKMLSNLTQMNQMKMAIVTGRSLNQIKGFLHLPNLIYVASHGLEIEGPDINYVHPGAFEQQQLLEYLNELLTSVFVKDSGIMIEKKTYTLSIHYRQVSENNVEINRLKLMKIIYPYLEKSQLILSNAKKVWELRPAVEWNKASAMLWLSGHFSASIPYRSLVSMYIGDDEPDEACFKIIRHGGFGVRVTENPSEPTRAEYYLRNNEELYQFLELVNNLKAKS